MDEAKLSQAQGWGRCFEARPLFLWFSGLKVAVGHRVLKLDRIPAAKPRGWSKAAEGVLATVADVQEAILVLVLQVLRCGAGRSGVSGDASHHIVRQGQARREGWHAPRC